MSHHRPDPREVGRYFALAQVGLEMAAPIALGAFLDARLGWAPWGVVVGAVLGLVGGMAHLLYLLKRFDEKKDSTPPRGPS